ncbi:MAG TPA: amidase family protein [Spirochaetia bacterium]|nr:amidase family protein [Spirochaetia bacterium]
MSLSPNVRWKSVLASADAFSQALRERDKRVNSFLEIDAALRSAGGTSDSGPLAGLPIAVKDNIAVRGFQLTCGSKILSSHVSPYDATVVARLAAAGAVPVGKTNLDEFGMGSSTDNSAGGSTNNPWDLDRVAGGSSGGSAAAVAAGLVPLALGTDTGGSVRQPAAFCGVYGLKPTYGSLSRYGLVAYASSLEVAGLLSYDIDLIRAAYRIAAGEDVMDQTSVGVPQGELLPPAAVRRVAFLGGELGLDASTAAAYRAMRELVESQGVTVDEVELETADYVVPAYYTIATAEASANLARFNGIRYGERPVFAENPEELVRSARGAGFGSEVKLRILLGTYVLRSGFQEQYYQRAQRIRTAIRHELGKLYETFDLIMLPTFPTVAFHHGERELDAFQQKVADRFTTMANLAALPALSIPAGIYDGLPVGIQAMGPAFSEERLLSFAELLAKDLPPARPPAYGTPLCDELADASGGRS